jgi:hypothetical protein
VTRLAGSGNQLHRRLSDGNGTESLWHSGVGSLNARRADRRPVTDRSRSVVRRQCRTRLPLLTCCAAPFRGGCSMPRQATGLRPSTRSGNGQARSPPPGACGPPAAACLHALLGGPSRCACPFVVDRAEHVAVECLLSVLYSSMSYAYRLAAQPPTQPHNRLKFHHPRRSPAPLAAARAGA